MKRLLKWAVLLLAALVGLAVIVVAGIYYSVEARLEREYTIPAAKLSLPDPGVEDIERGRHIVTVMGFCGDCHGEDFSGQIMEDTPLLARLVAANLTSGEGGVGRYYSDADWVRAIRYGVDPQGRALLIMPSEYFNAFSDADLSAMIAYLKSLPPVDNVQPEINFRPIGRALYFREPSLLAAEKIDPEQPRPVAPAPGVTVEYGRYLANICTLCHGPDLAGLPGFGGGMNLTPAGDLARWNEAEFLFALRTGITPERKLLDPELMPWKQIGQMTDDELKAIWLYLQSVPPVETPAEQG